jgi:hypothetical protein
LRTFLSGLLRSVGWFITDVSEDSIGKETSVKKHPSLRNNPEERNGQLRQGQSVKNLTY